MPALTLPTMQAVGPDDAKIMLIGEAPGSEEELLGRPFVGASGKELGRMLQSAGLDLNATYRTNVFHQRPVKNDIESFCVGERAEGIRGMPALIKGKYVRAGFADELERLYAEIERVNPNVIVPLGNTPCWAVFRAPPKISGVRGRVFEVEVAGRVRKVIPTYHPAYILRNWKERVVVIQDFNKVKRQSAFPEMLLPKRRVLIDPTFDEVQGFFNLLQTQALQGPIRTCTDVETSMGQITVAGIATGPDTAIVIPFWDERKESNSYWDTPEQEAQVVQWFREYLANPRIEKILQNGMYDLTYFEGNWKARCMGFYHDTMLLQHAMWPEQKKGLADLASIHTDEAGWKMMRLKNRDDLKRDE